MSQKKNKLEVSAHMQHTERRAEGDKNGFARGEQSDIEKGNEQATENFTLKILKSNYRLAEISTMTGLSIKRLLQIAKNDNLEKS